MNLSNNPKLSAEKLLIFGALGLYLFKYIQLQRQGQLAGDPDLMLKIDKKKMFDAAAKQFNINPLVRTAMEGIYDTMLNEGQDE